MAQLVDPHHCGRAFGVHDEPGFGAAFLAFGRDGVWHFLVEVAVAGFADVPSLNGVFAEAFPGLFEGVAQEPLGDALFHAAYEDLGGALLRQRDRSLVGGEQRHPDFFQLVFELGGLVGPAGGAFDLFDHDRFEPAVGVAGLGHQVGQAAVSRDRDVERLVRVAQSTQFEVFARGFHVVEEGDDDEPVRQHLAAVVELAWQRQRGILQIARGGAQEHRDRDRGRATYPEQVSAVGPGEGGQAHAAFSSSLSRASASRSTTSTVAGFWSWLSSQRSRAVMARAWRSAVRLASAPVT
ncbi:hypothetical protein LTT61_22090 [Nocardia asteroides]|nr:hypothetical protein [Nocardia asteroides]UGT59897.1 hypothetical protein LTT61_22090 [Nocardia asteroides]